MAQKVDSRAKDGGGEIAAPFVRHRTWFATGCWQKKEVALACDEESIKTLTPASANECSRFAFAGDGGIMANVLLLWLLLGIK